MFYHFILCQCFSEKQVCWNICRMVFDILLLKIVEIELPVPFKCVVLYITEFEVGGVVYS